LDPPRRVHHTPCFLFPLDGSRKAPAKQSREFTDAPWLKSVCRKADLNKPNTAWTKMPRTSLTKSALIRQAVTQCEWKRQHPLADALRATGDLRDAPQCP